MITVRYRHNYAKINISARGVVAGHHVVSGNKVMCLVNNQQIMMAFGGIVHAHKATLLTPAVVLNIEAYTFDETGLFNYIELPTGTKLKGVSYQNRVYLLVTPNKALIPVD